MDLRQQQLQSWVAKQLDMGECGLEPLVADASFRRYFRFKHEGQTKIALDAPPELEDSHSLVKVTELLLQQGLNVPKISAHDLEQGFLVLEDLGDDLYFSTLTPDNADELYRAAIDDLMTIIKTKPSSTADLPNFDYQELMQELLWFKQWYLQTHLELSLSSRDDTMLDELFTLLVDSALEQPQICVHRDYHSRNLMVLPERKVGIIDFQDALWGPLTYDLVSLIRDCYVDWPHEQVNAWLDYFYNSLQQHQLPGGDASRQQMQRWFDLMGMHRHLKAIFIFARKYHRDGNSNYLGDIPRALTYVAHVIPQYPELANFAEFFQLHIMQTVGANS